MENDKDELDKILNDHDEEDSAVHTARKRTQRAEHVDAPQRLNVHVAQVTRMAL